MSFTTFQLGELDTQIVLPMIGEYRQDLRGEIEPPAFVTIILPTGVTAEIPWSSLHKGQQHSFLIDCDNHAAGERLKDALHKAQSRAEAREIL